MENRIAKLENQRLELEPRSGEPQRISAILEELFHQYEDRFPGVRIAMVETPAAAA